MMTVRRREALGIRLEGNVVIVDEGHNLADAVASTYSAVLTERMLSGARSALSAYLARFRPQLSAANLRQLSLLESLAKAFTKALTGAVRLGGAAAAAAAEPATEARGGPAETSGRGAGAAPQAQQQHQAAAAAPAVEVVGLNEFLLRTGTDNVDLFRLCGYIRETKASCVAAPGDPQRYRAAWITRSYHPAAPALSGAPQTRQRVASLHLLVGRGHVE